MTSPTNAVAAAALGPDQVELHPLTIDDRAIVKEMLLDPEQEAFAGSADAVFDELQDSLHPNCEHPFGIFVRLAPVGFFILRERQAMPHWASPHAMTLHSLRICRTHQRRGLARTALGLAISWIRQNRSQTRQLMLAVNVRNTPARILYLDCGFADTGTTIAGPIGEQHILAFDLLGRRA